MSPEWLPEAALFIGGIFAGGVALYLLAIGERRGSLGLGLASLALLTVALTITRNELIRRERPGPSPLDFLVPAGGTVSESPTFPAGDTMSLLLGDDLRLLVTASKHHVLSLGGRRFLALDVQDEGMAVTCSLGDAENRRIASLVRNRFRPAPGRTLHARQPDRHTLLVSNRNAEEVLSVRYASPAEIRITGRFHLPSLPEPIVVTSTGGIRWPGGGITPHMTIYLTQYGEGTIDFERSGLIQVRR